MSNEKAFHFSSGYFKLFALIGRKTLAPMILDGYRLQVFGAVAIVCGACDKCRGENDHLKWKFGISISKRLRKATEKYTLEDLNKDRVISVSENTVNVI